MIRFGPSGNSDSFYAQGYQSTAQAPAWLEATGLNAMEYSCGRGVNIGVPAASAIGEQARAHGIVMSVHAPYYINLSVNNSEQLEKNARWIVDSARVVDAMGGMRVVLHPGSGNGGERGELLKTAIAQAKEILLRLDDAGLAHVRLCPETMGKTNQLGHETEIYALCEAHEALIPCFDFAHIHALGQGRLRAPEDFAALMDGAETALGRERLKNMHVHFSRVAYTKGGERRHMNFCDDGFGPDFSHLAQVLKPRGYEPVVICESRGHMAEDAVAMRTAWERMG